jgi:signal transduction histidine kinase
VGLIPAGRDVRVDLRLPEHPVTIHAVAPDRVRIFLNLLTNALKFSPREAR